MSWLKVSDNAAKLPELMEIASLVESDPRIENEVLGFLLKLYLDSAAQNTDYVISQGHLDTAGKYVRTPELTRICMEIGLITKNKDKPGSYKLAMAQDFMHLRLKEEIEWERRQASDNRNPEVTVPVRKRDGDNCRWCGNRVVWKGRKHGRKGSYDHLEPGKPATVETMVVACTSCNSARGKTPIGTEGWTLRPAPVEPYYTQGTIDWLRGFGVSLETGSVENQTELEIASSFDPGVTASDASAGWDSQSTSGSGLSYSADQPLNVPRNLNVSADGSSPLELQPERVPQSTPPSQVESATSASQAQEEVNPCHTSTAQVGKVPENAKTGPVESSQPKAAVPIPKPPKSPPPSSQLVGDSRPIKSQLVGSGRVGTGHITGRDVPGRDGHPPNSMPAKSLSGKRKRKRK